MLGAVIVDTVGSVYEWHNVRHKDFGPLFRPKALLTDDFVGTVAVADAPVNKRHAREALKDWGLRYWDNSGWGSIFVRWLRSPTRKPYNGFSNVTAMWVSPTGLLASSVEDVAVLSRQIMEVIHTHTEGLKGAEATALSIFLARQRVTSQNIKLTVTAHFSDDLERNLDDIRPPDRFNRTSQETVPQALVCALSATDFKDEIRNATYIGGDIDTGAAIAGVVAGAPFGIPDKIADRQWTYLREDMCETRTRIYGKAGMLM